MLQNAVGRCLMVAVQVDRKELQCDVKCEAKNESECFYCDYECEVNVDGKLIGDEMNERKLQ